MRVKQIAPNTLGRFIPSLKRTKLLILLVCTLFCLLAITATIFACGWSGTDHSVRFNTYRTAKEFGRLPPYSRLENKDVNKLFSWDEEKNRCYDSGWEYDADTKIFNQLWIDADEAIQEGNLSAARKNLLEYLEKTAFERSYSFQVDDNLQKRRNSAYDKLDALTALEQGSSPKLIQKYLLARSVFDTETPSIRILEPLGELRSDKNLKDNVAYLEAAIQYTLDGDKALDAFNRVVANFPHSEKREAALYMVAVITMKMSKSFTYNKDDNEHSEPCSDCRDEYWHKARTAFERVMQEYPHGRYYTDAQGWLAHLWLCVGDRAHALADYYRMLASKVEAARIEAVYSLSIVKDHADDEEMRHVEEIIQNEPEVALAYAYHNIYNYANIRLYDRCLWNPFDSKEPRSEQREVERIVAFANRMTRRYPQNATGGAFLLRLAEANLELENFTEAAKFARKALGLGVSGQYRAEALWVAGYSEFRLKEYKTAREALAKLVEENPNNRYTEGARRNLAMLLEDIGDINGALEQYLALDYRHDVAYFVDVLMKTDQLANFVEKHPNIKQHDELLYALGIRYLRDFRWDDARKSFLSIRTTGREVDWQVQQREQEAPYYNAAKNDPPKLKPFDPRIREIRPQWIEQDLRTVNDLERLEREYNSAQSDETKAEALYQFASHIYQGSLLFYNQLEWNGERADLIADLYGSGLLRRVGESQLLLEQMQKHDMASRSLEIYLDVVKKFPNTRAARDAFYTAAVCHERLREYNYYWREIYEEGGHAGERMVTNRDVKRAYPDYRFPLGSNGWEPATRTVNGGPGWVIPPKPKPRPPRPTMKQRVFSKMKLMAKSTLKATRKSIHRLIKRTMRFMRYSFAFLLAFFHCLWIGFSISTLWFIYRRARQSRQMLRDELARCKPLNPPKEEPAEAVTVSPKTIETEPDARGIMAFAIRWGLLQPIQCKTDLPSLSVTGEPGLFKARFGNFLNHDLRDKWIAKLQDFLYKANQLRQDERGRSVLALSLATHSMCLFLLFNLLLSW